MYSRDRADTFKGTSFASSISLPEFNRVYARKGVLLKSKVTQSSKYIKIKYRYTFPYICSASVERI